MGQVCIRDCHHNSLLIFNKEELWWVLEQGGGRGWRFVKFTLCHPICLCFASPSFALPLPRCTISTGDIAGHTDHLLCTAAFHSNPFFLPISQTLFQNVVCEESKRLFGFQSADSKLVWDLSITPKPMVCWRTLKSLRNHVAKGYLLMSKKKSIRIRIRQ